MIAISVRDLSVSLGAPAVVRGIDLDLPVGCLTGLIGPNGAGKTTVLRALAGLTAYGGRIDVSGRPLAALTRTERARTIAYLAQERAVHWPLPVAGLVALGRLPHRAPWQPTTEADRAAVARALRATALEGFAERPVSTLSGGERARALLARALAVESPILLADEPTAALDPFHQLQVLGLLRRHAETGATVVAVMHDLTLAARFCHRLVLLHQGRVEAHGAPGSVLSSDHLARTYRIAAIAGRHGDEPFLVPWQPLADP